MLFMHWGPNWYTPSMGESRLCLVLSTVVATLLALALHCTTVDHIPLLAAISHYTAINIMSLNATAAVLLKLSCFIVELVLLESHGKLIRRYPEYFYWNHTPGRVGVIFVCMMLISRTLILRYDLDASLVMYNLEIWFWAVY